MSFNSAAWLRGALAQSGMRQSELARRMTYTLQKDYPPQAIGKMLKAVDRAAVNKMAKGSRRMTAEELVAISQVTAVGVPGLRPIVRDFLHVASTDVVVASRSPPS